MSRCGGTRAATPPAPRRRPQPGRAAASARGCTPHRDAAARATRTAGARSPASPPRRPARHSGRAWCRGLRRRVVADELDLAGRLRLQLESGDLTGHEVEAPVEVWDVHAVHEVE